MRAIEKPEAASRISRPIIPWIGSKGGLADKIIPLFPRHRCYVEVFAGAGSVLFRKPESKVEILNDINLELITLYRVVKNHLDEFVRYLRWLLAAREEFERFKAIDPSTLTDVQRAVRFYYLHKNAFAPGVGRPTFRSGSGARPRFNLLRIEENLSAAHLRLSGVVIENMHYANLVKMCDKPDTMFYLDPPYYGCERDYGAGVFARDDYQKLADQLGTIRGRFLLSMNDTPEIRRIYRRFKVRQIATRYYIGDATGKPVRELLIMNYRPES